MPPSIDHQVAAEQPTAPMGAISGTPFSASGISATISSSLKMIADMMALAGSTVPDMSTLILGNRTLEQAVMMAKYFGTSLAIWNVRQRAAGAPQLLPISTT